MARTELIIDDLSGAELSPPIDPTTITVDGTDYKVDLGDESKQRLIRWLNHEDALIKTPPQANSGNAGKSGKSGADTGNDFRLSGEASEKFKADLAKFNESKKEQRKDIQEWARASDDFKDAVPNERGGIKASLVTAYYKDNPEAVHYYGSDAVEPPQRADYRDA